MAGNRGESRELDIGAQTSSWAGYLRTLGWLLNAGLARLLSVILEGAPRWDIKATTVAFPRVTTLDDGMTLKTRVFAIEPYDHLH
jgi:hypothetical protein